MAVTGLEIKSRRPYADGVSFGDVGPYERLDGTIRFAVDPAHAMNHSIVDLDRAPRDGRGRVAFAADFCLLRPADPARGNRRLFFEVLNRGRKILARNVNSAPPEDVPTPNIHPGNGFLMRQGYTLAWCGWQWDVIRSEALMGLQAPLAMDDGQPLGTWTVCQFQPNEHHHTHLLADRVHQPLPAADMESEEDYLTVRTDMWGRRTRFGRRRWRFAREEGDQLVPDATHIYLGEGFEPGLIYELVYRTRMASVAGTGLLAVRDCVSFLRHGARDLNPCAGQLEQAYGFGISQSGRFLRHFLYLGLNLDEEGRMVFDGVIPHVAGARMGEFNHRGAQPSVQSTPGFGHLFPFADDEQPEPYSGRVDGLLRRQRQLGGVPKIIATNTSAEYWRGDCSLLHTDPMGKRDLTLPGDVRVYHFAGTQHGLGVVPLINYNAGDGCRGRHGFNCQDYSPLLRAAIANLDRWVTAGEAPPPSAHPRLADGTAMDPRDQRAVFATIPGVTFPARDAIPSMHRVDMGPQEEQGIGTYPAAPGGPYPNYVSALDADGNEVSGIRLPDLTVPVATLTGWNPRHPDTGEPGQIINMQGSTFPFPATAAERQQSGDPRASIEERYPSRTDYLEQVRQAAEDLVAQRYLLAEDVEAVVGACAERYDLFAQAPAPVGSAGTR